MPVTKAVLDDIARDYHDAQTVPDKHIEDALQVHSLGWIRSQLAPARTVLELGFGEGILTADLIESGKQLTLVEGSAILVDKARRLHGDRVRCVHALFEEYAPAERFDAVLASHVLEHVDDPVALLKRMRGWLAPGGRVVIVVPNSESIHRRLAVLMGLQPRTDTLSPRDVAVGHQRVYSPAGLVADVEAAGFAADALHGFFFKPLPNSMMLGFQPELIRAMNEIAASMPAEWLANLGLTARPVVGREAP